MWLRYANGAGVRRVDAIVRGATVIGGTMIGAMVAVASVVGPAQADALPASQTPAPAAVYAANQYGEGFFTIPGTQTCLRLGGMARLDAGASGPQRGGSANRYGTAVIGRLSADARTQTDWGVLRSFIRLQLGSLTGSSVSGGKSRLAGGFGATGVDTEGRAQKGVELDRAFIQFGGLTAGRATSFFDFYAHELEMIGATPVSDPAPVDLLAWTFALGKGVQLTLSAESPIGRRTPLVYSGILGPDGVYQPGDWRPGQTPVGLVPGELDAAGQRRYGWVDMRQPVTAPDLVAALRIDQPWGAAQVSGVLRRIGVGGLRRGGAASVARRPPAETGGAIQVGVKVNLPMLGQGDSLWLQGAWGRGALAYTGAGSAIGFDNLTGGPSGKITAVNAEAYIDPQGRLRLSESWSALAALQHYWRPDLSQSIFAGMSRISYGRGDIAGAGTPGGVSLPLQDNETVAFGTRLDWTPVKDLSVSGEVAWTQMRNLRPGGREPDVASATANRDHGWSGKLRIQRDF